MKPAIFVAVVVVISHFASGGSVGAPQDSPRPATSTFGPFSLADNRFTVTMRYDTHPPPATAAAPAVSIRTLTTVAVLDAAGHAVYRRSFAHRTSTTGFQPELEGTAYEVHAESGTAIVIEAAELKARESPANPSGWMLALVANGKGLRVAGPGISFHGSLEHFPGPPLGPRQLRPSDLMVTREWTGYYSMIRGFRADFSGGGVGPMSMSIEACR